MMLLLPLLLEIQMVTEIWLVVIMMLVMA